MEHPRSDRIITGPICYLNKAQPTSLTTLFSRYFWSAAASRERTEASSFCSFSRQLYHKSQANSSTNYRLVIFFFFKTLDFSSRTSSCLHKFHQRLVLTQHFEIQPCCGAPPLICILPTKQNTPKDNKRRHSSGAVKDLSQLKRAAFYPRAVTIMNTGRTIRHTASLLQAATVFFFFSLSSSECP